MLLIGSILRICFFWMDTSFWGDEAALALNLKERTFSQFFKPLDHGQHAPPFYLLVEKWLYELAGPGEHALRLPSLVASLLSLPLFFYWLRKRSSGNVLAVAFLLFAFNPRLILYSAQLKPYAIDVVSTLVVCLCACQLHRHRYQWSWLGLFAFVGCLLIWISFPVVFVLAGVGLTLIIDQWLHGWRRNCVRVILLALLWLISFAYNHYLITHYSLSNEGLRKFWENSNAFAPLPTSPWQVRQLVRLFLRPFADPLWGADKVLIGLPAVLWLVGLLRLIRSNPPTAGICFLPVVLTFIASGLKLYPFEGRLLLFLVPLFLLPVAWGIEALASGFQDRIGLGVTLSFLLISYIFLGNDIIESEFNRAGARKVVEQVSDHHQSGDVIYVLRTGGYRSVLWYRAKYGLGDEQFIIGSPRSTTGRTTAERDLDNLKGARRLWFVAAEANTLRDVNWDVLEMQSFVRELDLRGKRLYEFNSGISHAFLYDLGSGNDK